MVSITRIERRLEEAFTTQQSRDIAEVMELVMKKEINVKQAEERLLKAGFTPRQAVVMAEIFCTSLG